MKLAHSLRILALAALALVAAVPAHAQDVLKLTDGKVLKGKATRYDEGKRSVTFITEDGATHLLGLDQLDRLSAYKIAKARAPESDGPGQLKIANFARDIELYRYALRHYDNARKADANLGPQIDQEMVTLRSKAADYCMRNAQACLSKNDADGAEKWLSIMIEKLPNETQTAQASGMLDQLYARNHAAKVQKVEQSTPDTIKAELADGKKAYDEMIEKIRYGLANSGKAGAAKKSFESAWKLGEKAMKELDKVEKKHGDAQTQEMFAGYRGMVREHMVDAMLHLASVKTVASDYRGAMDAVNEALSIDPKNQAALEARGRVELAASNSGILGWN